MNTKKMKETLEEFSEWHPELGEGVKEQVLHARIYIDMLEKEVLRCHYFMEIVNRTLDRGLTDLGFALKPFHVTMEQLSDSQTPKTKGYRDNA